MQYANDRFWDIERKLDKIFGEKYLHLRHLGKPTEKAQFINRLRKHQDYWGIERWKTENIPKSIRDIFSK